jgi:hypothetical protein
VEVAADPGDGWLGIPSESVGCKEGATARPTPHTGKGVKYMQTYIRQRKTARDAG